MSCRRNPSRWGAPRRGPRARERAPHDVHTARSASIRPSIAREPPLVRGGRSRPERTARLRSRRAPGRATERAPRSRQCRLAPHLPHAHGAHPPRPAARSDGRRRDPSRCRAGSPRDRRRSALPVASPASPRNAFRRRETYAWSVLSAESGGSSGHSSSISLPDGHDLAGVQARGSRAAPAACDPRARSAGPRRRHRTGRATGSPREPPAGTRGPACKGFSSRSKRLQATLCDKRSA